MPFVLDTSVAVAWCLQDEVSAYAEQVLNMLETDMALVPSIWPLEVANALCTAERRQRLVAADVVRFATLARDLPIVVASLTLDRAMGPVLDLARRYQLTTYDASYLELAMREGVPLATEDTHLIAAATQAGVPLVS